MPERRGRVWWVGFLCLVACLEPQFEVCDDLACPRGVRCVVLESGPVCAPAAGCDTLADGDPCTPGDGHAGACEGGACIPHPRCGDGVVDGNESCDCGVGIPTRPACNDRNNSDTDAISPCRLDCTPRRCGDGILDAAEQCENDDLGGSTCQSLGFYRGELACSSVCTFDGCEGRCGDGVLDPEAEYCEPTDTTTPLGYCADFGFSAGRLRCSSSCAPLFTSCHDAQVFTDLRPGKGYIEMVSDHAGGAWVLGSLVLLHVNASRTIDTYVVDGFDLDSFGDRVAVALAEHVSIRNAAGEIASVVVPFPCGQIAMTGPDRFACFAQTGGQVVWCESGTCGTPFSTVVADDVLALADGTLIASGLRDGASYVSVEHVDATTSTPMASSARPHITTMTAMPNDGIYAGLAYPGEFAEGGASYGLLHTPSATGSWTHVEGSHDVEGVTLVGGIAMTTGRSDTPGEHVTIGARATAMLDPSGISCRRFVDGTNATALCLSTGGPNQRRLLRFAGSSYGLPDNGAGEQFVAMTIDDDDRAYLIGTQQGDFEIYPGVSVSPDPTQQFVWAGVTGHRADDIVAWGYDPTALVSVVRSSIAGAWKTVVTDDTAKIAVSDHASGVVAAVPITPTTCSILTGPAHGPLVAIAGPIACPTGMWVSPSAEIWIVSIGAVKNLTTGMSYDVPSGSGAPPAIAGLDATRVWVATADQILRFDGTAFVPDLVDLGSDFDWLDTDGTRMIASSGGFARTTWLYDGGWSKLRLPSDPTPMTRPMLGKTGVRYMDADRRPRFSIWLPGWP